MNCLNRIEIQKFIDNEVSSVLIAEIEGHLAKCSHCRSLYKSSLRDLEMINNLLSELDRDMDTCLNKSDIHVGKKRKTLLRIGAALFAAASVIALILFSQRKEIVISDEVPYSEIIIYEYYNNDLNKLWHEKMPVDVTDYENADLINPVITF
jgi:adenine-specific DNA methylase